MNYKEYSDWLVNFSNAYNIPEDKKLAVYLAGIIEEIGEYETLIYRKDEDTTIKEKKELGDVLAYLTLAKYQSEYEDIFKHEELVFIDELMQMLGGYLKRLYRGDVLSTYKLHEILSYVDLYVMSEIECRDWTLKDIMQINYDKLTTRKQLLGTGDDR